MQESYDCLLRLPDPKLETEEKASLWGAYPTETFILYTQTHQAYRQNQTMLIQGCEVEIVGERIGVDKLI